MLCTFRVGTEPPGCYAHILDRAAVPTPSCYYARTLLAGATRVDERGLSPRHLAHTRMCAPCADARIMWLYHPSHPKGFPVQLKATTASNALAGTSHVSHKKQPYRSTKKACILRLSFGHDNKTGHPPFTVLRATPMSWTRLIYGSALHRSLWHRGPRLRRQSPPWRSRGANALPWHLYTAANHTLYPPGRGQHCLPAMPAAIFRCSGSSCRWRCWHQPPRSNQGSILQQAGASPKVELLQQLPAFQVLAGGSCRATQIPLCSATARQRSRFQHLCAAIGIRLFSHRCSLLKTSSFSGPSSST